jgi:5'-methylthioadenosine phosphorylase
MRAELGIIGGTGFYRFFGDATDHDVDTPYGKPSAPISVADVGGRAVAFVPRHGRSHEHLPSEVPYAANLWALKHLGVTQVLAFNTVGSLQPDIRRGDFVFCDQYVDRTAGRRDTIFSGPDGAHISAADPYCPRMRAVGYEAVSRLPYRFHPSGTVVVIQGPRFSTRAESRWFSTMGWQVINMTQYPEVTIARELELCDANLSYVTDYDVATKAIVKDDDLDAVSHALVIKQFGLAEKRIEEVIRVLVAAIPTTAACACRSSLAGARVAR